MKVSLDTNVLLWLIVGDDEAQQQTAAETLERAELVAISVQALCEFVWVLDRSYRVARPDISASIRRILDMRNVVANRPTIEAGQAVLDAGGDFADGVIAFDGQWLGGETFVSFDRKAAKLVEGQGTPTLLLE
ncbi:PIN domain-containing protein [Mesorhizobium sp. M2A.F.Ca.ET.037.01.1.1]|uniref:type II toxin-antitoxin system VapC family toxin n=1 Tax=unclassified Mesorhizobium TaxID=325217 RepID=UPI000FCB8E08|nr:MULTISPECIES: type II toxin-antitoxin system VapC family toxin [unclassified Mesorhizobium]RUY06292.1 PIN domain-containing protein [Mesorhizobium sp. M2A.F.Ca.ET.040.01.1.1]RUW98397.1 PIN domain-containing protein [Mesorhizobium sp. M2A.F.Ca.ET.037.01.1.1]RWA89480.1 MAG: PIN domain-containing protein [Mesorhizobium sp.]RWE82136.1 MAG: PIN domain-containing protein [Mesorhizobium sp.]RWF24284.1 MAG: PIN domain-containing protein [Mesorhizobium sp.]